MKERGILSNNPFQAAQILAIFLGVTVMSFLSGCTSTPRSASSSFISGTKHSPITTYLPSPYTTPHDVYHEVGPSETLWRISTVYGVDMATIMRVNNIRDPKRIKSGQKLLIPNTQGPRANIPLYPTTRWTHIVIHHTATDQGSAYSINELHHKRGWENGMGYHFLIDNGTRGKTVGQIEVGPRWIKQMQGAHVKVSDWNQKSIGIALVGNYSEEPVPARMMDSLVFLVAVLKNFYQIPDQNIVGHGGVPGAKTECPGTKFPWQEFKRRLRAFS